MFYTYASLEKEKNHKWLKLQAQFTDYKDSFALNERSLLIAKLVYFYSKIRRQNPRVPKHITTLTTILDSLMYGMAVTIASQDLRSLLDHQPEVRQYLVLFNVQCSVDLQQQLLAYELAKCHDNAGTAKKAAIDAFKAVSYKLGSIEDATTGKMLTEGRTGRIVNHFLKLARPLPEMPSVLPQREERKQRYQRLGTLAELAIYQFTSDMNSLRDGLYRWFSCKVAYKAKDLDQTEKTVVSKLKEYFSEIMVGEITQALPVASDLTQEPLMVGERTQGLLVADETALPVAVPVSSQGVSHALVDDSDRAVNPANLIEVSLDSEMVIDRVQFAEQLSESDAYWQISAMQTGSLGEITKNYEPELRASASFESLYKDYDKHLKSIKDQDAHNQRVEAEARGSLHW